MPGRVKPIVNIVLFGRLRPTRGFHRAVAVLPQIIRRGLNCRMLLLTLPARPRYRVYSRDFKQLITDSPVRDRILYSKRKIKREPFLKMLTLADVILMPYEAGAWSDNFKDALKASKPIIASDLKDMAHCVKKFKAGIVIRSDREMVSALFQCTSGSSRPL